MQHNTPDPGENTFRCAVVEEIEDPFYHTIMLRTLRAKGGSPLGWLMDKDKWLQIRPWKVEICLPPEAILLLHD